MDLKKRLQNLKQRSNKSVYGDYIFSRVSALDTCQSEERVMLVEIKKINKEEIEVRQALTNALQLSQENERMHGHAYSTYTNVIYKAVFGKDAKNLREEYGISKKENLRDYFSEEELKAVQDMEMIVSGLVGIGWGYEQIKEFIMKQDLRILAA